MVRNKSQGQENNTDNRRGNQGEKLNNNPTKRGTPLEDEQRGAGGKEDKGSQSRKGNPGKKNDH